MGAETILLAASLAVSAGSAYENSRQANKARKEEKKLKKDREAELANETAARRQAAEKAATAGSRAGRGTLVSGLFSSARGAGITGMSTPAPAAATRATLFGN